MTDTSAGIFPIVLEIDTGPHEFQTVDDMAAWYQKEVEGFSWLTQALNDGASVQGLKQAIDSRLSAMKSFIDNVQTNTKPQIPASQKAFIEHWENAKKQGSLITHQSSHAKYCHLLIEQHSRIVAAYALSVFMGIQIKVPHGVIHPPVILGMSLASIFLSDYRNSLAAVESSFSNMQQNWNEKFHFTNQTLNDELARTRGDVAATAQAFTDKVAEADAQLAQQATAYTQQLKDAEEKWHALEELYNKQLALQAPVEYWRRKKATHAAWMSGTAVATAVIAIVVLFAFLHFCGTAYDAKGSAEGFVFANLNLKNVGMLIVISTFGIWLVRLGSKMFVSNLHLRTDAIERETMVQTYLALLKEDEGMSEDARNLMLQSIFRPATSGMVKDEGPINIIELAGHAVGKKVSGK